MDDSGAEDWDDAESLDNEADVLDDASEMLDEELDDPPVDELVMDSVLSTPTYHVYPEVASVHPSVPTERIISFQGMGSVAWDGQV